MANVLISNFSPINAKGTANIPCYFEGFINALLRAGNNVLHLQSTDFINHPWNSTNTFINTIDRQPIINEIQQFNPDICFVFNNSTIPNLGEIISSPIVIMQADSARYYNDKLMLKKNASRYYFCCSNSELAQELQDTFGCHKNKIIISQFATDCKHENLDMKHSISFIGTNFISFDQTEVGDIYKDLKPIQSSFLNLSKPTTNILDDNKISLLTNNNQKKFLQRTNALLVGHERRKVLELLVDLDLTIYGNDRWTFLYDSSIDLALAYDDREVFSLQENQNVYNSSKICINISHPQTISAFPWRVLDIAATNACLVSDARKDLIDFFASHVNIPTYNNRFEARQLCEKILQEDAFREDIVTASQECIKDKGRFEHRFKDFEQIIDLSLFHKRKGVYKKIIPQYNSIHKTKMFIIEYAMRHAPAPKKTFTLIYKILKFFKINPNYKILTIAKKYYTKK